MEEVLLIKLGEIVLKGLNRKTFEQVLLKNIRRRLAPHGEFTVTSAQWKKKSGRSSARPTNI